LKEIVMAEAIELATIRSQTNEGNSLPNLFLLWRNGKQAILLCVTQIFTSWSELGESWANDSLDGVNWFNYDCKNCVGLFE
jgi:hypothetical protein